MSHCLFCQIVQRTAPSHVVWENDEHLAFLSIYPNTNGVTVVVPKVHHTSYAFAAPDDVLSKLVIAAKRVGLLLDRVFADVGRTGMVLEGFGVDHLHAKLFPMHGTATDGRWQPIKSDIDQWFDRYEGYSSSQDSVRADDEGLAVLAQRMRDAARGCTPTDAPPRRRPA